MYVIYEFRVKMYTTRDQWRTEGTDSRFEVFSFSLLFLKPNKQ